MDTSANITTEKEVEIFVEEDSVKVKKEFDFSIDSVACEACGEHLMFKVDVDSCGDLNITVEKCDCDND